MIIIGTIAVEKNRMIFLNGNQDELKGIMDLIHGPISQPYTVMDGMLYINEHVTAAIADGNTEAL